jgi:hypothetical protein
MEVRAEPREGFHVGKGPVGESLAELGSLQKEDVLRKLVEKLEGRASTLAANLKLEAIQKVDAGGNHASGLLHQIPDDLSSNHRGCGLNCWVGRGSMYISPHSWS